MTSKRRIHLLLKEREKRLQIHVPIQRKGEDETFQLIQKIHNQLQEVQWDLQRLHSLHKYRN